tara:strand:- start:191 stop:1846 length:1656 start_codon:yes stop_codon:yes gene_type:complete
MAGGLLNLISTGNQNIILNGNPKKSFFKSTYSKYTNFGLQKFRIDFTGLRNIRVKEDSHFSFKIPRYGDLLLDTFLVVTLPHIWSPIFRNTNTQHTNTDTGRWIPYEFKWIDDIGTQMIKEVTITTGGSILQKYSGDALTTLFKRDLNESQRIKHDIMIGHVPELNDPANYGTRTNQYPNAVYDLSYAATSPEPSIRSKNIYIPLKSWFSQTSKQGFPLVATQYNEIYINITLRPVGELFVIKDVDSSANYINYVKPDPNNSNHDFYRFLSPPPEHETITGNYYLNYPDKRTDWNSDIHLISTYAFLSDQESAHFAKNTHEYLIKEIHEYNFQDLHGSSKLKLDTSGLISTWTFFLRRSDVKERNQWSNLTNWPYHYLPHDIIALTNKEHSSSVNPLDFSSANIYESGEFSYENEKKILVSLGILCDGKYKENILEEGIFNYIENYQKSNGKCNEHIYTYNFCFDNNPYTLQPSGAMNLSKFKNIEFEVVTIEPPSNPDFQFNINCQDGEIISVSKTTKDMFLYTYELHVIEERYNMLTFMSGNCGLQFAR